MPSLKNKKILLGISGGIAAYKTPMLVRLLVKAGADVRVICSPSALRFVTAETLATVSGHPVVCDFFRNEGGEWNNHVEMGLWADAMVIAPATANTLSKMASGQSDNLLLTTYLSARCPVWFAPAMDLDMYKHPATRENIRTLKKQGLHCINPGTGELASGLVGEGRMAEPEEIAGCLQDFFSQQQPMVGKKVLVTAGPTYENIDPVRFIGNHSSGKMGFAIAANFAAKGADVSLVSGPVTLDVPEGVKLIRVTSAAEMQQACLEIAPEADVVVMAAAVADYRPAEVSGIKIKKKTEHMDIRLVKNQDILAGLGKTKRKGQMLVGFALETHKEKFHAEEKLKKKNLDLIVLNSMQDQGAGFGVDTNVVTLIPAKGKSEKLPLMPKTDVAEKLVQRVIEWIKPKKK